MNKCRPDVPSDVRRQLRQEAGFGCCVCGHPFIQYHHIIPWAEDQHFRPEDMMVLCGQCHPLCTVGAITEAQQRTAKSRPKNMVDNLVRGVLFVNVSELVVHVAGGRAVETPNLLSLAGETVLNVKRSKANGRVLVSAIIHDSSGNVIARILDNEWNMAPAAVWDFEAFPLHAKIRRASGDIAFSIDVRNDEIDLNGKWYHKGQDVIFTPKEARVGTNRFVVSNASYCGGLIRVG